jgi:hypothetical protein
MAAKEENKTPSAEEEEKSWDDLAEEWEEKEGVKEFAQQAYQSLIARVEILPSFRVLDFGLPPRHTRLFLSFIFILRFRNWNIDCDPLSARD